MNCPLNCKAECKAKLHGSASECPALPHGERAGHDSQSGISWDGFNVRGDAASIREVKRLIEFAAARAVLAEKRWLSALTRPIDSSTHLVADAERGFVAPCIRGVIQNNVGTAHDWQYGAEITHWMPMPAPPDTRPKEPA
jgi:hypothetical protein